MPFISLIWFGLQFICLNYGVTFWECLSGEPQHKNCLAVLISDTWGGVEQHLIGLVWFGLHLISHKFHVVRITADLTQFWYVCLSGVFHHLKCLAVFITDT